MDLLQVIVGSVLLGAIIMMAVRPLPQVRKHLEGEGWQAYPVALVAFLYSTLVLMLGMTWSDIPMLIISGCAGLINIGTMIYLLGRTQKKIDLQLAREHREYEQELEREGL